MKNYEPETRELDVHLTDEEVQEKSEQLARVVAEISDLEEEKAKAVRGFSVQLKEKKRRLSELARNVTKREEMRPVLCYQRPDLRRFVIEIFRADNKQVIDSRAMTKEELEEARQGQLFDGNTHVPIRVSTDPAPAKGLPLDQPPAAEASADDEDVKPEAVITDPEDIINGKRGKKVAAEAKPPTMKKTSSKKKKRGMNIGGAEGTEAPEAEAATEETAPPAESDVDEAKSYKRCPSICAMPDGRTGPRCVLQDGHDPAKFHDDGDGLTWDDSNAMPPAEADGDAGVAEEDIDESDTVAADDDGGDGDG